MATTKIPSMFASPEARNFDSLPQSDRVPFTIVDLKAIRKLLKDIQLLDDIALQQQSVNNVEPDGYLTHSDINSIIDKFSLNPEQTRPFRIICNHALSHYPSESEESQLLISVFGADRTGKSILIEVI
jgi:hypothetical protein